jgi:hypothetical protein
MGEKWNKEMTMQEHVAENMSEQNAASREQTMWAVAELWYKGYRIKDISRELFVSVSYALQLLKDVREVVRTWHQDDLSNLAAERIEGFRLIQKESWDIASTYPKQANQLMGVIIRAEENIAKIQGVLSDKVHHIGQVTHHVKLYDFEDRFPEAIAEIQELEESHTPALTEPISHAQPSDDVVVMDGVVYEGEAVKVTAKSQS